MAQIYPMNWTWTESVWKYGGPKPPQDIAPWKITAAKIIRKTVLILVGIALVEGVLKGVCHYASRAWVWLAGESKPPEQKDNGAKRPETPPVGAGGDDDAGAKPEITPIHSPEESEEEEDVGGTGDEFVGDGVSTYRGQTSQSDTASQYGVMKKLLKVKDAHFNSAGKPHTAHFGPNTGALRPTVTIEEEYPNTAHSRVTQVDTHSFVSVKTIAKTEHTVFLDADDSDEDAVLTNSRMPSLDDDEKE